MKIAVINPNSTTSMTDKIAAAARAAAGPGIEIDARTCAGSPPAIQGPEDGEAAKPHLLAEMQDAIAKGAEAVVIACFDDPGLEEARELAGVPVVGIGQSAYHAASLIAGGFSVVTTLPVAIPTLEANIARYGLTSQCRKVRAAGIQVLDLEKPGTEARDKVSDEIGRAIAEDGAPAIVLGCAGMADLVEHFIEIHGVPVIDGVAAATGFAAALSRLTP